MLKTFVRYIDEHEDWLMGRILDYAQQRDYTKYTSTLKEPWRLSISGLSKSLSDLVLLKGEDVELGPNEDFSTDPATQYGMMEAIRHRERGVSLDLFLGLMKYYYQSYQDLIHESKFSAAEKKQFCNLIKRFFDRLEIAFCATWASSEHDNLIRELQESNLQMTNEKNKYLTIFESLSDPVFIVDTDGCIGNMNLSASKIFDTNSVPGSQYYKDSTEELVFSEEFPWLSECYDNFIQSDEQKRQTEKSFGDIQQYFHVSFSRSLDISGKFSGTIIIITNITERKRMEKELETLATTDSLTGAKNRRAFIQHFKQELDRSHRTGNFSALLMVDIDHFKDINDQLGHDTGDKVLKLLVAEVHGLLRATDVFGRWGGEEFIVLLPESDIHQATKVAERIRIILSNSEICTDNGSVISFTVSIGMTVVDDPETVLDDIIKKADKALYLAKNEGRNRVVAL